MAARFPYGGVAQLGEHLPCKQGVKGSNPSISIENAKHFLKEKNTKYSSKAENTQCSLKRKQSFRICTLKTEYRKILKVSKVCKNEI